MLRRPSMPFFFPHLSKTMHGAKFRSQNVPPVAGTSSKHFVTKLFLIDGAPPPRKYPLPRTSGSVFTVFFVVYLYCAVGCRPWDCLSCCPFIFSQSLVWVRQGIKLLKEGLRTISSSLPQHVSELEYTMPMMDGCITASDKLYHPKSICLSPAFLCWHLLTPQATQAYVNSLVSGKKAGKLNGIVVAVTVLLSYNSLRRAL